MKKRTRGRDFFSQPGSVTTWASPLPASRIAAIFAESTGMAGLLLSELEVEVEKEKVLLEVVEELALSPLRDEMKLLGSRRPLVPSTAQQPVLKSHLLCRRGQHVFPSLTHSLSR